MIQRLITVSGSPRERGRAEGELLAEQIRTNYLNQVRFYRAAENFNYQTWEKLCAKYLKVMEQYAPRVLEELRGMAAGAEVPFERILAMTTAYEKSFGCDAAGDKCTAFLATGPAVRDGGTLCGQTNDERMDEWLAELDTVVHHIEPETGLEVLTYTHPGIPAYMGMNNRGLAVLWTYIDNGRTQTGLPTAAIIRRLLDFPSIEEAVEFLQTVPHAIPNQFSLAHADGKIACCECFPNKVYVNYGGDWLAHTNHTLFAEDEPEYTVSWSTRERYEQIVRQIRESYGSLDVQTAKAFLTSHKGFPYCICVHPNTHKPLGKTLASMVFDVTHGEMHIAYGNACEAAWHTYRFQQA